MARPRRGGLAFGILFPPIGLFVGLIASAADATLRGAANLLTVRPDLHPYRRVIAPGRELISRSVMDKRYILRPRLLAPALALTISLAACGGGSPVTLKYITPGGPDNCYLPAFDGELVSDPTAVTVFLDPFGHRMPVLWPAGWTGRSSGSEVEVLDPRGTVVARTGTSFYPSGGLDADGNWEMCSLVYLPPAG